MAAPRSRRATGMAEESEVPPKTREAEWFVPRFGPARFRAFAGLLFLPYTGMVLSFCAMGSMLAERINTERLWALLAIYFLGLGVGAHALDAMGGKGVKPWGRVFGNLELMLIATTSLAAAYALGIYYMVKAVPFLWPLAVLEGFFVFAYNLEWFGGRFHNDFWFSFSWGVLPTLAGYVMQTNSLTMPPLILATATGLLSAVEIKISRPYKELRKRGACLERGETALMARFESLLKCISLGTILLGIALLYWRLFS